ncbi:sushi, von Willebrand factor type A, EGF and pentraxin domain-containing protein 1-like [Lytechinus variegatus]|uniref:sushi, von Willebrand factor type A, EGF and pentraxin domain-containing protein 1-like n=1 Tax=Lytechinus variegatus TaxID=7654 RepID=UPI001BB2A1A0|nr:sushi, von Willebrand factor type A, EGF and pentraxin domain-containing protein 1-like [Lytechinus variegatus]
MYPTRHTLPASDYTLHFAFKCSCYLVNMGMNRVDTIVYSCIYIQLFFASICVGTSPCMPETSRLGRYTVRGAGGFWSEGIPNGYEVEVSISCDTGAVPQHSVTSQCSNGVWIPAWPRCEKPCSVPRYRWDVRQFVNGDARKPVNIYHSNAVLPDGSFLIARCKDPGKKMLIGDQRRTCQGGQWIGQEPECREIQTKVLFYGASREVAPNGTVVVYVRQGDKRRLDVVCRITDYSTKLPRLRTPLENDGELWSWRWPRSHGKRLKPISTDFSGMFTCSWSSYSHSVHVLFKAAECEVPDFTEHGGYISGRHIGDIVLSGTTISFGCGDDYRLVGSRTLACANGKWSGDLPLCKINKCPELTIPNHALMEGVYGYGRNIGDIRIFHCQQGYILQGATNSLVCLENGHWSAELPTCEEPPAEPNRPSQPALEDTPLDYSSFDSLYASDGPSFPSFFDDNGNEETQLSSRPTPTSGNQLGINADNHSSPRTPTEGRTDTADDMGQTSKASNLSHSETADEFHQTTLSNMPTTKGHSMVTDEARQTTKPSNQTTRTSDTTHQTQPPADQSP